MLVGHDAAGLVLGKQRCVRGLDEPPQHLSSLGVGRRAGGNDEGALGLAQQPHRLPYQLGIGGVLVGARYSWG